MKMNLRKYFAVAALATAPVLTQAGEGNNHVAVFLGNTAHAGHSYATTGIEYEYRTGLMDRMIGVGVVYESIDATGGTATVTVAGVVVHPWKDLKVNVSAGTEESHGVSHNLTRIGVGYDFHVGGVSVGPVYNSDTIVGSGTADVYGVAIGMGF